MSVENPPAFPHIGVEVHGMQQNNKYFPGMTLRDYFAGQIITGLVTGCPGFIGTKDGIENYSTYARGGCNSALAERAYVLADAMLLERSRQERYVKKV